MVVEKQSEQLVTVVSLPRNLLCEDSSVPVLCCDLYWKGCLLLGFCVVCWCECLIVLRTFMMFKVSLAQEIVIGTKAASAGWK